jgi:hypothetical protein
MSVLLSGVMMMMTLWVRAPFGALRAYLVTACFSQPGLFSANWGC